MTWIEQTERCIDCSEEVTLHTDGRVAIAFSRSRETIGVWRDGLLLVTTCPAQPDEEPFACNGRITFTGEGPCFEPSGAILLYAQPISDEEL